MDSDLLRLNTCVGIYPLAIYDTIHSLFFVSRSLFSSSLCAYYAIYLAKIYLLKCFHYKQNQNLILSQKYIPGVYEITNYDPYSDNKPI